MRINFLIISPEINGGARIITQYAKYLEQAGHDVRLLSLGRRWHSFRTMVRLAKRGEFSFRSKLRPKLYDDAKLNLTLFHHKENLSVHDIPDADVTIATWWRTAEWLADLPESKGVKAHLIQGHEAILQHGHPERAAAVHHLPTKKIVVSQWLKKIMKSEYGINSCFLVENGVDTQIFYAKNRIKQKAPTVGFIFTSTAVKNSALAVETCKILKEQLPDLRVNTFGAHDPQIKSSLPDWMTFTFDPSEKEIVDIYSSCDVWLFTSRAEGFGLPILEALSCGTPVVATHAGAAPQIIAGEYGALSDMKADSMVNATKKFLTLSPESWRRASQSARKRAIDYDIKKSCAEFEKALRDIVAQGARTEAP